VRPRAPAGLTLGTAAGFATALTTLALVLGRLTGVDPLAALEVDLAAGAAGAAGTLAGLAVLGWMLASRWPPVVRLRETAVREVAPLFAGASTAQLAAVAGLAGFSEELFFRAFLQRAVARVAPEWLALAAVSVLFGLCHLVSPAYAVGAAGLGLALGGLLLVTGNVLGPMLAHAGYDLAALLALRRLARDTAPGPAREPD